MAVGQTAAGIFVWTSGAANGGATAGLSLAVAVLTFPRPLVGGPSKIVMGVPDAEADDEAA